MSTDSSDVTLSAIRNWDTGHLSAAAVKWTSVATTWETAFTDVSTRMANPGGTSWDGPAAGAAQGRAFGDRLAVIGLADQLHDAAQIARSGVDRIRDARQRVLDRVADVESAGYRVREDFSVTVIPTASAAVNAARKVKAAGVADDLRAVVADLVAVDREVAGNINGLAAHLKIAFAEDAPADDLAANFTPSTDGERRCNEIESFREVFGRPPETPQEWKTAAALDPHSYDPMYKGADAEIRAVRIRPVPGQGLVRSSQWIPQLDVSGWPPPSRDFGNNRGPDPQFDPANTKVTTYIDFENGLVVMRQNPSIEQTPTGAPGSVRTGTPRGTVSQSADGSVRITYDAGNPFAPGFATDPNGPMAGHQVTVNGDLAFTPGPHGIQIGGTRTDYPSMEVYQDMPGGTTHTVLIDPAQSGRSWGPALNLPFHHNVGVGRSALAPFDIGGWNPTSLPATEFGPVTNPPTAIAPHVHPRAS